MAPSLCFLLYFETGSRCVALAGLKLTETCLPLPSQYWDQRPWEIVFTLEMIPQALPLQRTSNTVLYRARVRAGTAILSCIYLVMRLQCCPLNYIPNLLGIILYNCVGWVDLKCSFIILQALEESSMALCKFFNLRWQAARFKYSTGILRFNRMAKL